MVLHQRFMQDFPEAVIDDVQMLYAIARRRSKVSANRFHRMFRDIGAPIQPASASQAALFDNDMIEAVFACHETAFDYSILENLLSARLASAGVEVRLSTKLVTLADAQTGIVAGLSNGSEVTARYAFNDTYSQVNAVLDKTDLHRAQLKHELTELALVTPPPELEGVGVTVMDGPSHALPSRRPLLSDACALYASQLDGRNKDPRVRHPVTQIPAIPRDTYDQRGPLSAKPAHARYERSLFEVKDP